MVLPQETALLGSKTATARSFTFTPHKNHRSDERVFDLSSVFEQWTNVRPCTRRSLSLVSTFGQSSPFGAA